MITNNAEPKNIRAFNWLTLKILSDLYEAFPEPIEIKGLRFIISTVVDIGTESEEAEYVKYFTATMRWLSDEGFIKYESESAGDFRGITLTLRGLTVLGYTPTSLSLTDRKEPIIKKIRRVLAKGAEGMASDAVKMIIVKTFGMMISGAGN